MIAPTSFVRFAALAGLRLEPGQRVHDLVAYDGIDPADLEAEEDRAIARRIFGRHVERVPAQARAVTVQVKGRDVGGTRRGAVRAVHLAATNPLERLDPDELAVVLFVAPKLRLARIPKRFALTAAKRLGITIEGESADGFTIVRHDGRRVAFECIAAARAGDTGRGVPVLFALLDEAAFFLSDEHVANGEDIFNALAPRLLPGGQIAIVSSPWLEGGLLYKEFTRNHGRPTTALASFCPTLVMRSDPHVLATVARESERDPENARREFGAEFLPVGSALFFDAAAIRAAADNDLPHTLAPGGQDCWIGAGFDGGFVHDSSAGCVVRRLPQNEYYEVAETFEARPSKGAPLVPSRVVADFARVMRRHGADEMVGDVHYAESIREAAGAAGIDLVLGPGGQAGKLSMYLVVRDLLHSGRLRIPPKQVRLLAQLREVTARPTPGGGTVIASPRRSGGGHGDLVSALVAALWRCDFLARCGGYDPIRDWLAQPLDRATASDRRFMAGATWTTPYRRQIDPPAGAAGVVRSPSGVSYTDSSGVRRHILN